jgi:hypothetical protein
MVNIEERLEKLGLKAASKRIIELRERQRKLALAYEHYRFVRQEKIDAFNAKLMKETHTDLKRGYEYKTLSFTPLESYDAAPPESVLDALETAIGRNCFDSFEVAHIITVVKTPDPILFGRINACPDRFYISQWDNDVSIDDLLKTNEG